MSKTARKPTRRRKVGLEPLSTAPTEVPIDWLKPSTENKLLYRKRSIDNPDDARFARSIATEGVLVPILVSRDWYVISGHGRLWAALLAGFATVPIIALDVWREGHSENEWLARLREHNEQRVKGIDERIRELMLDASEFDRQSYLATRLTNSGLAPPAMAVSGLMRRKAISKAKKPLLDAVLDILQSNRKFWPYSVRRLHYAIVSRDPPPLVHAAKPNSRYDNDQRCYKALVDLVARARLAGLIDMRAVNDETRPVDLWRTFPNVSSFVGEELKSMFTTYWRDLMQSQLRHVEIVAEKLTVAPILKDIAAEFCIPMVVGRGYCSLEPRYAMAKRFRASGKATSMDSVRGCEGDAARCYFEAFDHMIRQQREFFPMTKRSRRPPLDPLNALLSFVYSVLTHDIASAVEAVGLDPAVGFLHVDRPGRLSLALDLLEEFRPLIADRLVLALINRRQVSPDGFETQPGGAVLMNASTRKTVLAALTQRKREEITHPLLGEMASVGLLPHIQARLMARHLRGDIEDYPALMLK
jgi:hypothetical protein